VLVSNKSYAGTAGCISAILSHEAAILGVGAGCGIPSPVYVLTCGGAGLALLASYFSIVDACNTPSAPPGIKPFPKDPGVLEGTTFDNDFSIWGEDPVQGSFTGWIDTLAFQP